MTDDDQKQQTIPEPVLNFTTTPSKIQALANKLNQAEGYDTDTASPETLADYVDALKELESVAEQARKDVFEPALDDHIKVGESVGNLTRHTGTRRYVTDNAKAFDEILEAGLDPREYAKVNVGDLEDALGGRARELLGEQEYSYYRRQG